jgi:predicted transcriptional regulator
MEFLQQLLEAAMNKKYKIWMKDGRFTVSYAPSQEEALNKLKPEDKQNVEKVEELS